MSYWINAKNFDGYEVSNDGQVRNKKTGRILKPYLNRKNGYERVDIGKKHVYVHILIASSFFSTSMSGQKITHIDNNKRNNSIKNLVILDENYIKNYKNCGGK